MLDARDDHALVVEDFELIEYFWDLVAVHLGGKANNASNVLLTLDWQRQGPLKKHRLPPGEWLDVMEHIDTVVILPKVKDTSIAIEINSTGDITQMRALPIKHPIQPFDREFLNSLSFIQLKALFIASIELDFTQCGT